MCCFMAKSEFKNTKHAENAESKKLIIMRTCIACVMAVFFIAWIFNLKYQFKTSFGEEGQKLNLGQAKANIDEAIANTKNNLENIKRAREQIQDILPQNNGISALQIELLKNKLTNENAASGTIKY